jgi:hypothetical protein
VSILHVAAIQCFPKKSADIESALDDAVFREVSDAEDGGNAEASKTALNRKKWGTDIRM